MRSSQLNLYLKLHGKILTIKVHKSLVWQRGLCPVCLFLPLNTFSAQANGAVTLWGWCHPQIPLPMAFGTAAGLCLQEQHCVPPAGHQHLVPTAQEKGRGLSICVFLCAASVYFLLF